MASREQPTEVRLGVRADRAELSEWLRARAVACAVGPAESGGWVAVALAGSVDPVPLAAELSTVSGAPIVVSGADGTLRVWRDGGELAPHDATALVAPLDLPRWLDDPVPAHTVVCYRGDPHDARDLAGLVGPAWLVPSERGWILMGCDEPEMAIGLAQGMSSLRRRHPALALWRHDDQGGYLLFHRGRLIDTHIWNSPWEHLVGEQEPGDAELLARSTGAVVDLVLLRALLRRRGNPGDLLAELTQLLRLPVDLLYLLEHGSSPDQLPDARRIAPTSVGRIILRPHHGLWRAVMYAAVLATAVFGLLAVVGVTVLATNGASIEQDGVTADDITAAIVTPALTIATASIAWWCRRQLNKP